MGPELRLGWEESEHKEFMKAIRQPLMVQTPLQLVIENLFQRVQSQALVIQQMREKMDRIAVKDVTADELLDRIKLLESRQGESSGPKLNPFNQQEILARLEAMESKLSEANTQPKETSLSTDGMADVETRLQRLEKRMNGVYNLNGKLVAVEQIAAGLGVAIPDLDYPTGGGVPQTPPQVAAPLAWRPPPLPPSSQSAARHPHSAHSQQPDQQAELVSGSSRPVSRDVNRGGEEAAAAAAAPPSPSSAFKAGPAGSSRSASPAADATRGATVSSTAAPAAAPAGAGGAGAGPAAAPIATATSVAMPTSTSLATSVSGAQGQVPGIGSGVTGVSAQKLVAMGQEVAALREDTRTMREGLDSLTQQVVSLRSGLNSSASESLSRLQALEEGLGALRAQVADLAAARREAANRTGSEVSFADFNLFKAQVEVNVAEARHHASAATALAERDLPALAARVEEVAEGIKKSSEPRDIDSLFHERINGLEAALGDLRTELRGSVEAALEGAAKLEELQALADAVEARAPAEALRALQQQAQVLGQAVASISDTLALRPELADSLRAGAGAVGASGLPSGMASPPPGPAATKLRCLTCDQPISPMAGGGGTRSGRSFLPRLESLAGKEGPPVGPGLMVAELRASKEERLSGVAVVGAGVRGGGLKAGDLEEYANGLNGGLTGGISGTSPGRDASPGRAVERSRAARVPVGGTAAGKPGAPHGKPVFL